MTVRPFVGISSSRVAETEATPIDERPVRIGTMTPVRFARLRSVRDEVDVWILARGH